MHAVEKSPTAGARFGWQAREKSFGCIPVEQNCQGKLGKQQARKAGSEKTGKRESSWFSDGRAGVAFHFLPLARKIRRNPLCAAKSKERARAEEKEMQRRDKSKRRE